MADIGSSSVLKPDRKTIEKNRRDHMKSLYSNLMTLIPRESPRETNSISDQLEKTVDYIKKLEAKLEELKQKKTQLMGSENQGLKLPDMEIHTCGSTVHVALITGVQDRSMLKKVVRILEEEGADVVHANFSVVDQTVFHTVGAQTGDESGVTSARLFEKLKKFVYHIDAS